MNLAAFLTYLGNATQFPFWGGWVVPPAVPANAAATITQITVGGVTLNCQTNAPAGELQAAAFYRRQVGGTTTVGKVKIYVANYGQPSEAATLEQPIPAKPTNFLTLAGIASALGNPAEAITIYQAIMSAAEAGQAAGINATPAQVMAELFAPALVPFTGSGINFYDASTTVAISAFVSAGILTIAQQAALAPLSVLTAPTDFS